MRIISIVVVLLVSLVSIAVSAPSDVLATASAPYFEDAFSRRVLANIECTLRRESAGARLVVSIHAVGAGIDSVHGFEGIDGSNHITAREMGRLFGRGAMHVQVAGRRGRVEIGKTGRIPERRFVRGRGFVETETEREYPIELRLDTGVLECGHHELVLVVDERARLRIPFEFDGERGRVVAVESLGVDLLR